MAISIAEKAKVDLPFMCALTDKTEEQIYNDLEGVIFLNPLYNEQSMTEEKYLPADEYLSGNVREKLRIANLKAETDSRSKQQTRTDKFHKTSWEVIVL